MARRKTIEYHLKDGPFDAMITRPDADIRVLELREDGALVEALSFGEPFRTIAKVGAIRCKPMPKRPRPRSDEAIFAEEALRKEALCYPDLFAKVKEAGLDQWAVLSILSSFSRYNRILRVGTVLREGPQGKKKAYALWAWAK